MSRFTCYLCVYIYDNIYKLCIKDILGKKRKRKREGEGKREKERGICIKIMGKIFFTVGLLCYYFEWTS